MGQLIPENCTKNIDNLGRITLPKGLRDRWYLQNGDEVEVFTATVDGRQCVCLSKPIDKQNEIENAIEMLRAAGYDVRPALVAMEEDVLMNDLRTLARNFYKVVEINVKDDTYYEVKSDCKEIVVYNNLRNWFDKFGPVGVHEEDRERFYEYRRNGYRGKVYYRRLIDDSWRWVCMETFDVDDEIKIMVVRDVEDYIKSYKEQVV